MSKLGAMLALSESQASVIKQRQGQKWTLPFSLYFFLSVIVTFQGYLAVMTRKSSRESEITCLRLPV
jgi:hypothetical protein